MPVGLYIFIVFNTSVLADAGIEPRTVAVYALTVRAAISTRLHLVHLYILSTIGYISSTKIHLIH
jgi:hypothetical protein